MLLHVHCSDIEDNGIARQNFPFDNVRVLVLGMRAHGYARFSCGGVAWLVDSPVGLPWGGRESVNCSDWVLCDDVAT